MILVGGNVVHSRFIHKDIAKAPLFKPAAAEKPPFTVKPAWPTQVSAAAIGAQNYGVLATHGDPGKHPTASLAKVITMLAILERHPLKPGQQGPQIPITAKDEQLYRDYVARAGSVTPVKAGVSLSEYQALEAMMLPSANNVADTTAIWAFGSLKNYQRYATQMVQRLNLSDTIIGPDGSGMDPHTQSTASDLVKLGEIALQNPVIAKIVAQPSADIPYAGTILNYNRGVTQHGYTGIKIGESDEAGITLLYSTKVNFKGKPITLVGAELGAPESSIPQDQMYTFMESAKHSIRP